MTLSTEVRRFKDIVGFRLRSEPFAFNAETLEVAEISNEAFASLPAYNFLSSDIPQDLIANTNSTDEASNIHSELKIWANSKPENSSAYSTHENSKIKAITLNVTQLCNLHCSYCAAGGDGTYGDPVAQISIQKTLPQLDHFLAKLENQDTFHLTLLGGEPLLYANAVRAIVLHINELSQKKKLTTKFNLITNGTLIDANIAQFLAAQKVHVTVSMDGPPQVNDKARPQKDLSSSSEKTLRGLDFLFEAKCEVLIHSVFTRQHCDPKETYLFFSRFPVRMEFTLDLAEKDPLVVQRFVEGMNEVAALAFATGEQNSKESDFTFDMTRAESELRRITLFDSYFSQLDQQTKSYNHCGSGKNLLSIDSRNQIYSCPLDVGVKKFQIGSDLNIQASAFDDSDKSLIELNNCQTCWARHLCGGGCMFSHLSMTGEKHKKDPAYCTRTRHLISLAILYYLKARSH